MGSVLLGIVLLCGLVQARADQLMFEGITSNAYSPLYPTPEQAAQWVADNLTPTVTRGSACAHNAVITGPTLGFNATATWFEGVECILHMFAICRADDGSIYSASVPTIGHLQCRCPASEAWDPVSNVCTSGYHTSANRPPKAELGHCCTGKSWVSDPIDPSVGNVYTVDNDFAASGRSGSLSFARLYNSTDTSNTDLGIGWRHTFSRTIKPSTNAIPFVPGTPLNSSLYADATTACTGGFSDIQSQVSSWQGATATYLNGVCTLTKSGTNIGTLPILTSSTQSPVQTSTIVAFDVIRDDGQLIRITNQNGVLTPPPGSRVRLLQTSMGFTLTDESDNVEAYDADGRLLSVTSRAGLVQTMSYDTSARLSTVTDNFGHQLTLSYDSQGRLSSVTRQ